MSSLVEHFDVGLQDVQILFVDLQSSLVKNSKSISADALTGNALVLAKLGRLLDIPMTFSVVPSDGKAGSVIKELKSYSTSENTFQRRLTGSFSDPEMVSALARNERRVLVVSGYVTEVAVLQSVIAALKAGYIVHVPVDTMGSPSSRTEAAAIRQMELMGAIPTSVLTLVGFLVPDLSAEPGLTVLTWLEELSNGH